MLGERYHMEMKARLPMGIEDFRRTTPRQSRKDLMSISGVPSVFATQVSEKR